MKVDETSIEVKIASGTDRLGLANALFETHEMGDGLCPVHFKLEEPFGDVTGFSILINKMERESGNQTKRWVFEGTVSPRSREKLNYAVNESVRGYYDLNTRKGWMRFKRI